MKNRENLININISEIFLKGFQTSDFKQETRSSTSISKRKFQAHDALFYKLEEPYHTV